jgi:hypothetical protein
VDWLGLEGRGEDELLHLLPHPPLSTSSRTYTLWYVVAVVVVVVVVSCCCRVVVDVWIVV